MAINNVGWSHFLTQRKELLDQYDKAKEQEKGKPVKTGHGIRGEAWLRKWLSDFLPRRFSVTSGYIIPQQDETGFELLHYDVIIYDAINAPILWIEDNADNSPQGL